MSLGEASGSAVTVVLAAGGYPADGDRGTPITGVDQAEASGALVFHAGTAVQGEQLVTNGGRIVGVTGLGATIGDARAAAYSASSLIRFEGMRQRSDIALAAAAGATFDLTGVAR